MLSLCLTRMFILHGSEFYTCSQSFFPQPPEINLVKRIFQISPTFFALSLSELCCSLEGQDFSTGQSPGQCVMLVPDHSLKLQETQLLGCSGRREGPRGPKDSPPPGPRVRVPFPDLWPDGKCSQLSVSKSPGRGVHASRPRSDFGLEAQRVGVPG